MENAIRDKEAERIMKYVKEDTYVITLEINGKLLSSEELSAKINQLGIQGTSHITFIIGGSIGYLICHGIHFFFSFRSGESQEANL